ncbi:MAG TPA: hypothetical protein VGL94_17635 [Ktedonobacteraceae bacterium]
MIRLWYHLTWYMMPILVASIIASGEFLVTYEPSMNAYVEKNHPRRSTDHPTQPRWDN